MREAEAGNRRYRRIFEQMGNYLGLGIANFVNLINPERVVICEGAVSCAHLFEKSMRATIQERVIAPLRDNFDLVIHHWGDAVWARGAASLVLQELDQRDAWRPANRLVKAAKRRRKHR